MTIDMLGKVDRYIASLPGYTKSDAPLWVAPFQPGRNKYDLRY